MEVDESHVRDSFGEDLAEIFSGFNGEAAIDSNRLHRFYELRAKMYLSLSELHSRCRSSKSKHYSGLADHYLKCSRDLDQFNTAVELAESA